MFSIKTVPQSSSRTRGFVLGFRYSQQRRGRAPLRVMFIQKSNVGDSRGWDADEKRNQTQTCAQSSVHDALDGLLLLGIERMVGLIRRPQYGARQRHSTANHTLESDGDGNLSSADQSDVDGFERQCGS